MKNIRSVLQGKRHGPRGKGKRWIRVRWLGILMVSIQEEATTYVQPVTRSGGTESLHCLTVSRCC